MIRVKLPNGTVVECDTPEEAAKFTQQTGKPKCDKPGCYQPHENPGSHCNACGNHHYGMC
jgi:hypothetical protein